MTIFCPVGQMSPTAREIYCIREADLTEAGAKRRFKNMYAYTSVRLVRIAKLSAEEVKEKEVAA